MNRRTFMQLSTVTAVTPLVSRLWPVYLPIIERAKLAMANGWGLGISYQLHDNPLYGLQRALSVFDPQWWHDWSPLTLGATPALYENAQYTDNPTDINRRATSWPQVLWGNEPGTYIDFPEDTAIVVRDFKAANPHVKVYGFGSVERHAEYIETYTASGGPTLDGYHFHAYMNRADEWSPMWDYFRRIAGDKPVILSEFGGWSTNTPEADHMRIMDTVRQTLDTDSQLQAAAWFCAKPKQDDWQGNTLLDDYGNLTNLGRHWLTLQ